MVSPTNRAIRDGVLYTEHLDLKGGSPFGALWSFESMTGGSERPPIATNADGNREFWLDRSDPLLNTILPGTGASITFNFADRWSAGRSLRTASQLPAAFVIGPVLRPRLLRVGHSVRAIGAAFPAILTRAILGVPPSQLVDQIVPLHSLWRLVEVERLTASLASATNAAAMKMLKDRLLEDHGTALDRSHFAHDATQHIRKAGGRVSINDLAQRYGMSRQKFAREFADATGMPPKMHARLTRFQALVGRLLTSDVSQWVEVSSDAGFYDQAHMINEFRALAGVSPIEFFRPHGETAATLPITVRGRPSEWRKAT
jgi:AraC-like DNA-binding protein